MSKPTDLPKSKSAGENSDSLKTGLAGFLLSGSDYKKIESEAGNIANAIDKLAKEANEQNEELLKIVINQALVNMDQYLHSADPEVKRLVLEILGQAQLALNQGLKKLFEINQEIKEQKKKLKERIEQISKTRFRR